jgi:hypothetical protein
MHLVYVHNLPDMIWLTFERKQGVWILFAATSTATQGGSALKVQHRRLIFTEMVVWTPPLQPN